MLFKNIINSFFAYNPTSQYSFSLSEENNNKDNNNNNNTSSNNANNTSNNKSNNEKVFDDLNSNLNYMQNKYNIKVNSDIVLREFLINVKGKKYNAFIVYIDGMVDSQLMNEFILKPLMLRYKNNSYNTPNDISLKISNNNVTIKRTKKINLEDYLINSLIPQNSVKKIDEFDDICNSINSRKLCIIC